MNERNNEITTIGGKLTNIFNTKRLENEEIIDAYFQKAVAELYKCAEVGKTIYFLDEEEYPEIYSDDSTIRNIFEEELLCEDIFLYFNTNKYKYTITFIYKKLCK